MGPYSALQKENDHIQLLFPSPVNWGSLKLCDLVVMQRACSPEHLQIMNMAKDLGIPVIFEIDDDNLAVPKDNPTYPLYSQMAVKDAIVKLARGADAITCSTEFLRTKYGIYNKNTFLIPNALDNTLIPKRSIPATPRNKMVLWRGTSTHERNLEVIQEAIVASAAAHPDWVYGFLGWDPYRITERFRNHQIYPQYHLYDYFKALCQIRPTTMYYSLANNDHALSRSHISWLEATYADTMMIGPDIPEFHRPGMLNFNSPKDFLDKLEAVINGQVDVDKQVKESWDYIQEFYLLSKINKLRKSLIEMLVYGDTRECSL